MNFSDYFNESLVEIQENVNFEYVEHIENMTLLSSVGLLISTMTFIIMTIILVLNKLKKKQSKKILKIIWIISLVILIIMAILLIKFTNMPV